MTRVPSSRVVIGAVVVGVLGGTAVYAQDKYSLKSPSGIAFSDFRGYEDWGIRAVQLRSRIRQVHGRSQPFRLRTRMPCGSEGEGPHLPPVPEALIRYGLSARCPLWDSGHFAVREPCPLYPHELSNCYVTDQI
jgi:hypothetical protein